MIYRPLGKTGKELSAIGLGCEHLDGKPYDQVKGTVETALNAGINIFEMFMPGREIRENVARALGDNRKKVMIQGHLGSTDINQQYDISRDMPTVKKYFEDLLRIYGGYIDFGMLFFIDNDEAYNSVFESEFIDYAMKLKEKGDILHLGFSSHNPETAIKVIKTGLVELMMFSINPAFDMLPSDEYVFDHMDTDLGKDLFRGLDPRRAELYKLCSQEQIGITVMKALGGGRLISEEHSPFARPMTVHQCVHYALSRPSVASVLTGCKTSEEMLDVLSYFDKTDEEKDYSQVLSTMRNDFKGNCVYCSHCQPCPVEIDIATVNKYLDIAQLDSSNIPPSIKSHYNNLSHKGDECIACGSCEERCPFSVPIIENMEKASKLFS